MIEGDELYTGVHKKVARRVARMDYGADGSGDTFSVGHVLWTQRAAVVQKSYKSLVPGHPANERSDLADRWGEALWESLV
jgi:hypothetical protein